MDEPTRGDRLTEFDHGWLPAYPRRGLAIASKYGIEEFLEVKYPCMGGIDR
jgi:hypothetical protein